MSIRPHHRSPPRRGSALGAAMILALMVALLLAGLIKWSMTERNITNRHVARAKALLVAESVDQYGAAKIKARLDQMTYFADDEFRPGPGKNTISVNSIVHDLLDSGPNSGIGQILKVLKESGTSTTNNPSSGDGYFRYEVTPENLVVGRFSTARWERADSSNPLYVGDPLIDQTIREAHLAQIAMHPQSPVSQLIQQYHMLICCAKLSQ